MLRVALLAGLVWTVPAVVDLRQGAFAQNVEELMQSGQIKQEMRAKLPEFQREVEKEESQLPEAPTRPAERKRGVQDRAVDPDQYSVGPGDRLTIYFWGTLDKDYTLTVTPEGTLLIPTVGELNVANRALSAVRKDIIEKVRKRYDKVEVSVILIGLREFRVHVFGQVASPASYIVTGVDRVSDLIDLAGGLADGRSTAKDLSYSIDPRVLERESRTGTDLAAGAGRRIPSARSVQVRHQDGTTSEVDLVLYKRTGDLKHNPYIQMGDILYVPVAQGTVTIYGKVRFPGAREFKEGDTIEDHLFLAGGVTEDAAIDSVEIARFGPDGRRSERIFIDLREHVASLGAKRNFVLQRDDRVFIRPIPEYRIKYSVSIGGEALRPGSYAVDKEGLRLTELVRMAGGFTPDASLVDATVVRGKASSVVDAEYERLKRIPHADMTEEERKYFASKQRERSGVMLVDFKKLFVDGDQSEDIVLVPQDNVDIPLKRETVGISGRVKQPGLVRYSPDAKVKDYLAEAGGFAWNADKGGMRLVKAEAGLILKPSEVKEIHAGDTIWVPAREPRNWGRAITNAAEVAAAFAPMIISILVTTR